VKPKIVVFLAAVVVVTCTALASSSYASGAGAPRVAGPSVLGPLVAADDTPTLSWGRDGGAAVPLPNGKMFWVFADTPKWKYQRGAWKVTDFVHGSSAGVQDFTFGQRPTSKFLEVNVGKKLSARNQATLFMANPRLPTPDGTGGQCAQKNAVRWPTGAALMPDKVHIFIPFVDVCIVNSTSYPVEGWGFSMYDWKQNKFSIPPYDVFKPTKNGAGIPVTSVYRTPIVVGKTITMYTLTLSPNWSEYSTTIPATVTAIKNIAHYASKQMSMPATFLYGVAPPSKLLKQFTLFMSTNTAGGYEILSSSTPTGPWVQRAIGTLPNCTATPLPCTSFAIRPEVSSASKVLVSYYVPGNGPTVAGHPNTNPAQHPNFGHILWASIPI
jgi:hypothetical protein